MKRERFVDAGIVLLVGCALVITGLVVRRELAFRALAAQTTHSRPTVLANWRLFAASGHRLGPAKAPVTLVVFSDFECPYCRVLMERLHVLRRRYPEQIAILYRHFPSAAHPEAVPAARASECADEQGRFEAFASALFAQQDSIGLVDWDYFARKAGVADLPRFRRCSAASAAVPELSRDSAAGKQLPVVATPTLLINERRFVGVQPLDSLDSYVRRALRSATYRVETPSASE